MAECNEVMQDGSGFWCTEPEGHKGDHLARNKWGDAIGQWPNEMEPEREVKHHPGPYILEPRRVQGTRLLISAPNTSRNVAEVILRGFSAADRAEQEATGKLLAAAPRTLAALNDLIDLFEMTGGDVDIPGTDSWTALYLAKCARDVAEGKLTDAWGCPHKHTTHNADGSDRRCYGCGTLMPEVLP